MRLSQCELFRCVSSKLTLTLVWNSFFDSVCLLSHHIRTEISTKLIGRFFHDLSKANCWRLILTLVHIGSLSLHRMKILQLISYTELILKREPVQTRGTMTVTLAMYLTYQDASIVLLEGYSSALLNVYRSLSLVLIRKAFSFRCA